MYLLNIFWSGSKPCRSQSSTNGTSEPEKYQRKHLSNLEDFILSSTSACLIISLTIDENMYCSPSKPLPPLSRKYFCQDENKNHTMPPNWLAFKLHFHYLSLIYDVSISFNTFYPENENLTLIRMVCFAHFHSFNHKYSLLGLSL